MYYTNPQMNPQSSMFIDFPKFIKDLKKAIKDQRSAVIFYSKLYEVAPTETAKYAVKTALDDEKIHDRKLTELYIRLTGHQPKITVEEIKFHHFYEGLKIAFLDEVKAYEMYKMMYLSTFCPTIRDILYDIQHDEMEHATLFNWVHAEIK